MCELGRSWQTTAVTRDICRWCGGCRGSLPDCGQRPLAQHSSWEQGTPLETLDFLSPCDVVRLSRSSCAQALQLYDTMSKKYFKELPAMQGLIEASTLFASIALANDAMRSVAITQCEVLICRTFIKKSDPMAKVEEICAQFQQELKLKSLATAICPYLWGYICDRKGT
jgi:hypothetical protein